MNWAAILWLGLLAIFLIAEAVCALHMVSIWFAAGALVALLTSLLGGPVELQVILFVAVSFALLIAMWPLVRKLSKPNIVRTNVDAIIGTRGRVTAPIDNICAQGAVKLGPMEWTARSTDGTPIEAGTLVQVDRIEGVKAFVSPVPAEEPVH